MAYDTDNIFAKVIRGEIPNNTVYEDEFILAFHDIAPAAPVHVLVIPKGAYVSFDDFAHNAGSKGIGYFFTMVRHIAHELGLEESGYRLITNHGENASQSVPHFHVHILGGTPLGGLLPGDVLTR